MRNGPLMALLLHLLSANDIGNFEDSLEDLWKLFFNFSIFQFKSDVLCCPLLVLQKIKFGVRARCLFLQIIVCLINVVILHI